MKLEGNKNAQESKKWRDDASAKSVCCIFQHCCAEVSCLLQLSLARSEQENIRLKEEISRLKQLSKEAAKEAKESGSKESAMSRFFSKVSSSHDISKQSKSVLRTAVKCKMGLLQSEV